MMIPKFDVVVENVEEVDVSSRTYSIRYDQENIMGKCDGLDAVRQAIYLILNTERYEYVVYSPNYGIELNDLIGMNTAYVIPELERRITEALTQDDRIESVADFQFDVNKNKVNCKFIVATIFGTLNIESEVNI